MSQLLGIPQIHIGHCPGRSMLEAGRKEQSLERQFNFTQRIVAEEAILSHATMVVSIRKKPISMANIQISKSSNAVIEELSTAVSIQWFYFCLNV
jgi:hypothetical protein